MSELVFGSGIAFVRAAEQARGGTEATLEPVLGAAQLIGTPPEGAEDADWSFQTRAMSHGAASMRLGIDLWRAVVFPVRKVTKTFPGTMLVGRASSGDVLIDHPSISKLHARIRRAPDGTYTLQDAGSRNGTAIDGKPVGAQEVPLVPGASVRLGDWTLRFERLPETLALLKSS
ncbi:FHA domain-containing protein [Sandaracinus amylolyticus]|uniref:FHA domain-containing protein n=1 Tax=Sandaracinus amylolyticus TaxID=927083 RepID=A0A0F6VYL4_9BACT|nr:FHA domain-containing protein [Sandaracinus amylolyticus]AKF02918.1 hypothetical protein DB32_000066 [Sandaracinus amylolyticus]